jgi:hypothetical protein
MIRVVIAEDHNLVRQGIRALLEQSGEVQVVAEAATGEEAIKRVEDHQPDCDQSPKRLSQSFDPQHSAPRNDIDHRQRKSNPVLPCLPLCGWFLSTTVGRCPTRHLNDAIDRGGVIPPS